MKYDFDKKVDRSRNHSAKWDEIEKNFGVSELLPMWVADMDFETAPEIVEAMKEKVDQRIFGYVSRHKSYYESASSWTSRRYGYDMDPDTLLHSPGVIPSISIVTRIFAGESDKIMIQPPVYSPFAATVKGNCRTLVTNPLVEKDGRYEIDFEDFEAKAKDPDLKWFILCNPHNPVGRVWTRQELERMARICLDNGVRVIADEIWRDLVYKNHMYTPFASLSKEVEDITISCFSATKTFNIAGLQASFISLPRREEFERFDRELGVLDIRRNNPFSLVGIEAAFSRGEAWLEQLLVYLQGNAEYVDEYLRTNIPSVKLVKPEGTYVTWLDFRELGLGSGELSELLKRDGKVALSGGAGFGQEGTGFARMNIACPRYMLEDGMERIKRAVEAAAK